MRLKKTVEEMKRMMSPILSSAESQLERELEREAQVVRQTQISHTSSQIARVLYCKSSSIYLFRLEAKKIKKINKFIKLWPTTRYVEPLHTNNMHECMRVYFASISFMFLRSCNFCIFVFLVIFLNFLNFNTIFRSNNNDSAYIYYTLVANGFLLQQIYGTVLETGGVRQVRTFQPHGKVFSVSFVSLQKQHEKITKLDKILLKQPFFICFQDPRIRMHHGQVCA